MSIFLFSLLASNTSASAEFRVCNETTLKVSLAIAYTTGQNWLSQGWWNLKGNTCQVILRGDLKAQYYYIYAMDERGGEWKGRSFMCTRDKEFEIQGRDNCAARGFDRTGFFEIDTGASAINWSVKLTENQKEVAPPRSGATSDYNKRACQLFPNLCVDGQ